MKSHRRTAFAWIAALALVGGIATGQEPFSTTVGNVSVGPVSASGAVQVPFIFWGGDVATFHANGGLETESGSIFDKQGLKLKLTPGDDFPAQVKDYVQGKSPFLRGTMSMLGLASEVVGKDPRTKPVVFLQLTWSAGDHMVSRESFKTLNDLKGKKIALQKGGPHIGMLNDILRTAQLKWSDIKVVWTDDVTGDNGPGEIFRKDATIDACFVVSPDMAGLTGGLDKVGLGSEGTVKGARVLVSTATSLSHSIADVYACRKDYFDAHRDVVEKFAAGYVKACEEIVAAKPIDKEHPGQIDKYKAILRQTQAIFTAKLVPTLADADGLISDCEFVGLPGNRDFFTRRPNLVGFDAKMNEALDLAVGEKYAKERVDFVNANLDYSKVQELASIAGTKLGREAPDLGTKAGETIYSFVISFEPDDDSFSVEKYRDEFEKAVGLASLYGNAIMEIRGHADPTNLVRSFIEQSVRKGVVRLQSGKYMLKDGSTLELVNTPRILELSGQLPETKDELTKGEKYFQDLSDARAKRVRDRIVEFAKSKEYPVSSGQLRPVGVGMREPVEIRLPPAKESMAKNRRVEFRLKSVSAEIHEGGEVFKF